MKKFIVEFVHGEKVSTMIVDATTSEHAKEVFHGIASVKGLEIDRIDLVYQFRTDSLEW